jgi:predicted transglutaminase-like cysteine proteinase
MCAGVRVLAVLCLVASCGGAATARSAPELAPAALSPVANGSLPAALAPQTVAPLPERGPFGLPVAQSGAMAKRWRALQPAIRTEALILVLCRADPSVCPASAARFLAIVDAARGRAGLARIGTVNRAVNLAIRPADDRARFGVPDIWTTPLTTFAAGVGDCEDYAIAKYVALREAGMADADLRLVIVHDRRAGQDHAVVAARIDGDWLILDNRTMRLAADTDLRNLTPLFALDGGDAPAALTVAEPRHDMLDGMALASRD